MIKIVKWSGNWVFESDARDRKSLSKSYFDSCINVFKMNLNDSERKFAKITLEWPISAHFEPFQVLSGQFRSFLVGQDDEMFTKGHRNAIVIKILPKAFLNALLTWFCDSVYGAFWTSKLSLWLSHLLPPTERRFRLRKFCTNVESSDSKSPSWFPQRGCSTSWRVCSSSLPVWTKPESCWSWRRADLNWLNKSLRVGYPTIFRLE